MARDTVAPQRAHTGFRSIPTAGLANIDGRSTRWRGRMSEYLCDLTDWHPGPNQGPITGESVLRRRDGGGTGGMPRI